MSHRPSSLSRFLSTRLFLALAILLLAPFAASADTVPDSVTIPLQLVQLASGDYKLGISVSLGGGPFKMYEFDTGAAGFYAANNTAWWPNFTTINATIQQQTYSSGIFYNSTIVNTTVDLGYGIPTLTANMAQIVAAGGGTLGNWTANVTAGIPPLYGAFFGDFGIGLGSKNGIFGLLPQLPGKLSNGFIIRTGGFGNPNPTLQIGITDADRAQFSVTVPMNGTTANVTFPNSGYPTYNQQIILASADFFLDGQHTKFDTGLVLDTGAPTTEIHDNGSFGGNITLPNFFLDGSQLYLGTNVTLTNGSWILTFLSGNTSGLNYIVDKVDSDGRINTGIVTFFTYDVMFDVERGVVGFYPNVLDNMPPTISGEPQSANVTAGAVVTLHSAANGNPTPNFQWQLSTNRGRTWSNITAASYTGNLTPSLSFVTTKTMNGYCYRVLAYSVAGSTASASAVITVGASPAIVRQPAGATIKTGRTVMLRVIAKGTGPLQYEWQLNGSNLVNGGNIRGATTAALMLSRVTAANAGNYRVVVTNPFGVALSLPVVLNVQP